VLLSEHQDTNYYLLHGDVGMDDISGLEYQALKVKEVWELSRV
jgi:hypothetical protein